MYIILDYMFDIETAKPVKVADLKFIANMELFLAKLTLSRDLRYFYPNILHIK